MSDFWTLGPAGAALHLRARGYSWPEAERLVRLKLRYDRGQSRETTDELNRLHFATWLVDHGRLSDELPSSWREGGQQAA